MPVILIFYAFEILQLALKNVICKDWQSMIND